MIVAVEYVRDARTRRTLYHRRERRSLAAHRHALERGVLLRPLGNVLYFMPPYVISAAEIDTMVMFARTAFDLALQES
jgi:adenosylmethionine-8-amino-7-oxononanoate aminotransferase